MIERTKKEKGNFTMISNELLRDTTLSASAKGIMCYLLSCKDDFDLTTEKIMKMTGTKRRKMDSIIKELIDKGYLERKIIRDKGTFVKFEFIVHERPITKFKPIDEWTDKDFADCPF